MGHHFNADLSSTRVRGDLSPVCLKPEAAKAKAARLEKLDYYKASANTNCAKGAAIETAQECLEALQALGLGRFIAHQGHLTVHNVPAGCAAHPDPNHHHFNADLSSTRVR